MITVEGLSYHLPRQGRPVFENVSFRVPEGSVFAILGPNGRGKTTLLKSMLGLLRPTAGNVTMDGVTGYVPQGTHLPFPYSVLDIVVMGRARRIGVFQSPGRDDYAAARRALGRLRFLDFAERPVTELSGGERQMVLIARAIASEAPILVLDEPTSALDFKNQDRVLEAIARIAQEDRLTVLFTTHYPQHALHVADTALAMHGPDDARWGPVANILSETALSDLYGLPIRVARLDHQGMVVETVAPVFRGGTHATSTPAHTPA